VEDAFGRRSRHCFLSIVHSILAFCRDSDPNSLCLFLFCPFILILHVYSYSARLFLLSILYSSHLFSPYCYSSLLSLSPLHFILYLPSPILFICGRLFTPFPISSLPLQLCRRVSFGSSLVRSVVSLPPLKPLISHLFVPISLFPIPLHGSRVCYLVHIY
jgi:hypothetical protein